MTAHVVFISFFSAPPSFVEGFDYLPGWQEKKKSNLEKKL